MRQKISNLEYKRKYFMEVISESFAELHHQCIESEEGSEKYEACKQGAKAFFNEQVGTDSLTINAFKEKVNPTLSYFGRVIMETAEKMAEEKSREIMLNKDLPIDPDPKMSEEDKILMDAIFTTKKPEDEITAIRDATADALFAENRKAEEIKEALKIVGEDGGTKNLQESVNNIGNIGPTSLMNAILSKVTEEMLRGNINESFTGATSDLIKNNAEKIKEDAMVMYSLFECINCFGFKTYSSNEIKTIAHDIYFNK